MPPRFDFDGLILHLSVADLLDRRQLGHLGFAQRGGYERMWLGQAIHSRYQEQALERDPTYQREVPLQARFQHRGWEIRLQGRLDGLRRDEDGSRVVEEIKSVRRGGSLPPATQEIYARQALTYAWMVAQESARDPGGEGEDDSAVRAELILIEIGGESVERLELDTDLEAVEAEIQTRLNAMLRAAEAQRMGELARRDAGEALTFPHPEPRPGQDEILAAVETALANGEHLLLEAPTGIGKTVAALYPALRHCLRHGKRLFVLTAKTLQQDMAMKVLELLNGGGAFHSLRLRAKAKMCANDQVLCHEEYCPFAKDYFLKLHTAGVLGRLLDEYSQLEPDRIFSAAKRDEVCPFEVSLELTDKVQATVCDYNYVFDPYVALTDFGGDEDLSDVVLVIDEVHNLVQRGRDYYSPQLSSAQARRAGEITARGGDRIHFQMADLCERLARLIDATVAEVLEEGRADELAAEAALPEDDLWQLRPAFDHAFIDYLEYRRETKSFRAEDPFVDLYFAFLRFLDGLMLSDASFSHSVVRAGEDCRLKILCRDPSRFLGSILERVHSVIGLSATLSPPEFYRDLLGFEAGRTAAVSLPSPFPADNRAIVIDSSVATTWKERPSNYGPIADRLGRFADAVPGNCLALFPSYAFLAEVATRLPDLRKRVLVQERANSDRDRQEILDHLRSALLPDVFLLAVAGGVFAEGVDYPGDMLKGVAIVSPCLPAVSLEQRQLQEYYQERFEKGFEYAAVVPGMTRVVQAAGRLIRSPEDTGVIALLDRRFLQGPYRNHLPSHWIPEDGLRSLTGDPSRIAEEFFGRGY